MAELMVRVVDKVNKDFYLDTKCTKRGDVIVVCPDGWNWGTDELASAEWQLIKMPGVDPSDLDVFIAPEMETDPANPSRTLQPRAFKFDLDKFAQDLTSTLSKDVVDVVGGKVARTADVTVALDLPTALTYQVAKSPIADINSSKL